MLHFSMQSRSTIKKWAADFLSVSSARNKCSPLVSKPTASSSLCPLGQYWASMASLFSIFFCAYSQNCGFESAHMIALLSSLRQRNFSSALYRLPALITILVWSTNCFWFFLKTQTGKIKFKVLGRLTEDWLYWRRSLICALIKTSTCRLISELSPRIT